MVELPQPGKTAKRELTGLEKRVGRCNHNHGNPNGQLAERSHDTAPKSGPPDFDLLIQSASLPKLTSGRPTKRADGAAG